MHWLDSGMPLPSWSGGTRTTPTGWRSAGCRTSTWLGTSCRKRSSTRIVIWLVRIAGHDLTPEQQAQGGNDPHIAVRHAADGHPS